MRAVRELVDADLWPSAASAYAAARDFMTSTAPEAIGDCQVRPVPVAGRFALQLETPRGTRPPRVLGYVAVSEVSKD